MFDNGLNCGRWVQVTIGNYCTGVNDGAPIGVLPERVVGNRSVQRCDA